MPHKQYYKRKGGKKNFVKTRNVNTRERREKADQPCIDSQKKG